MCAVDPTATDRATTPLEDAQAVAVLAASITNEREFIVIMQQVKPALREQVYDAIAPHLGYAGVRPFDQISFDLDA